MKIHRETFTSYQELETYFVDEILPRKDLSSKVIGKTILYWKRQRSNVVTFPSDPQKLQSSS